MKKHSALFFFILVFGALSSFAEMNDAKLKERLTDGLLRYMVGKHFYSELTEDIGDPFSHELKEVTDEQFHRVLMEIYNEAEEKWRTITPNTPEWRRNKDNVVGVLVCLPMCGEIPVKVFLLEYAVSKENDTLIRCAAVSSYLSIADAEETKNILLRFFVGEERTDLERLSIYGFASMAYDESGSPEKKAAILAALAVAADNEEEKIRFMKVDGILAERSTAYRKSKERLTMLERHSLEPPTANLYTDRDLKAALAESRQYKLHTNINTNLEAVLSLDFNLPQSNGLENGMSVLVPIATNNEEDPPVSPPSQSLRPAVPLALAAGLLAAFALWRSIRKKKP